MSNFERKPEVLDQPTSGRFYLWRHDMPGIIGVLELDLFDKNQDVLLDRFIEKSTPRLQSLYKTVALGATA
jgi:hypothetical protein